MKLRILKKKLRKLRKLNIRLLKRGHLPSGKCTDYMHIIFDLYQKYFLLAYFAKIKMKLKSENSKNRWHLLSKAIDIEKSIYPKYQIDTRSGKRKEIK